MSAARLIVEAMHGDLERFDRDLGARSTRLATEHMAELRRQLLAARLDSWDEASKMASLVMTAGAVQRLQAKQAALLGAHLPAVAEVSRDRQAAFLRALDKRYTGVARPLRFDTLAWLETQSASQIRLRQFSRSFARYGAAAVREVEDTLAKLTITGQPWHTARTQVAAAVRSVTMGRQWMVDRILRTETAAIYNGTALAAMLEEDDPADPMLKRLVAVFDGRTGWDSVAVHGQLRPVREPFKDPRGRLYMAPPNRPHDREVVVPHRAAWGEHVDDLGGPDDEETIEETAEPEPLPLPPRPPPALRRAPGSQVPTAAATVLLLSGQVAEARRSRGPGEPPGPLAAPLLRELEDARIRLAGARLAELATADIGIRVGSLTPGELLSAAGLAVRVAKVQVTARGVHVVLAIGDAKISGEFTARLRLPLRRAAPTLTPSRRAMGDAAAVIAAAIGVAIVKHGGSDIAIATG